MKNYCLVLSCFFVTFIHNSFAGSTSASHANHSNHHVQKQEFSVGSGLINGINKNDRTINISHGAIPSLKWPAMTMDIAVSDDVDLSSLQEGQDVKFKIKLYPDNKYRIFKIKNK